jgi:Arc/MetJ-type ribon-helix-helix transcriptional regulator
MAGKREKVPVRQMPLLVKVNQDELKRIDELRAALGDFPTRPEVLRRAMERLHQEMCAGKAKTRAPAG